MFWLIQLVLTQLWHWLKHRNNIPSDNKKQNLRIAIIGSGLSGISTAIILKKRGYTNFKIFEMQSKVGGVWRDNCYPGAATESPGYLYSLSFEPNYDWKRKFPTAAEMCNYLEVLSSKYGLGESIKFNTKVEKSLWDTATKVWRLTYTQNQTATTEEFDILIGAVGRFNTPKVPEFQNVDAFSGQIIHTATWEAFRDDPSLYTGKKVAVIGVGASGTQVAPAIYDAVERLTIFQRTATMVMPKREKNYNKRASSFIHTIIRSLFYLLSDLKMIAWQWSPIHTGKNPLVPRMFKRNMLRKCSRFREQILPSKPLCCIRPVISDTYLEMLQRRKSTLVTDPIERFFEDGVVLTTGETIFLDTVILATGFEQCQYTRTAMNIMDSDENTLEKKWSGSNPYAYLGLVNAGFPNFFRILGPNTGNTNSWAMAESGINYTIKALDYMLFNGYKTIALKTAVELEWKNYIVDMYSNMALGKLCDDFKSSNIIWALWPQPASIYLLKTLGFNEDEYIFG